jgi:hypothetical protein
MATHDDMAEALARQRMHSIVIDARRLITNPLAWTQGALARTADDAKCGACADGAVRWCGLGALDRAAERIVGHLEARDYRARIHRLMMDEFTGGKSLDYYNDHMFDPVQSHRMVLSALDLTAARLA